MPSFAPARGAPARFRRARPEHFAHRRRRRSGGRSRGPRPRPPASRRARSTGPLPHPWDIPRR